MIINDYEIINAPLLSEFTTFKLGGKCKALINCSSPAQFKQIIEELIKDKKNFIVIGQGSNLLVSDKGIDCYVIRYFSDKPIFKLLNFKFEVSGSTRLDDLVISSIENSINCLTFASGIPGTVAGAIVGNAGAFGRQIGDYVESVRCIDQNGKEMVINKDELKFSYRNSIFKDKKLYIISAVFSFDPVDNYYDEMTRNEMLDLRRLKHPDYHVYPCAGSVFKNINNPESQQRIAAGKYLDDAGCKGMILGGAKVFDRHANIIIKNDNTCLSNDVYNLIKKLQKIVKDQFNVELTREIRFVGDFGAESKELMW